MTTSFSHIDRIISGGYGDDAETVECSRCRGEFDLEDVNAGEVRMHKVGGEPVCRSCADICDGACGDWLDDDAPDHYGPEVNIRRWELDGKLGTYHAICAIDYLLQSWTGNPQATADYLNRFQIGVIVAAAFPQEVAR